jgi:hypothetical protein
MSTVQPRNVDQKSWNTMTPYGDRAGEYMHIERGRYDAWIYVVLAFLMQAGWIGGVVGLVLNAIFFSSSTGRHHGDDFAVGLGIGFLVGGVVAFFTFRDRWRCIEAFSSRWCSGVANLSLLYVPIVAFFYANARAVGKLKGK